MHYVAKHLGLKFKTMKVILHQPIHLLFGVAKE